MRKKGRNSTGGEENQRRLGPDNQPRTRREFLLEYTDGATLWDKAELVAEAPWSVAEWAVALRFDNPRATVLVLLLG